MQPVGSDHEIEPFRRSMLESDIDAVLMRIDAQDLITEDHFRNGRSFLDEQAGKIATPNSHEAAAGQLPEYPNAKARRPTTLVVDDPHLLNVIAQALDLIAQPHLFGDVVAQSPEIDHIATATGRGGVLDKRRSEPRLAQPVRERRTSDASARDKDGPCSHRIVHVSTPRATCNAAGRSRVTS